MIPADRTHTDAVHRDLEALLNDPRADEILLNEWLHDGTLLIPSAELLEYLAMELLMGFGKLGRFFDAGNKGTEEFVRQFVGEMKQISVDCRWKSVAYSIARMKAYRLVGINGYCLSWWPCIRELELDDLGSPFLNAGKRRLVRLLIESMSLRAVFMRDVPRLEGLVKAVRADRDNAGFKTKKSELIAFQMLRWHPYLTEKLGRKPQQSEMRVFLLEVFNGALADHESHWADAAKLVRFYPEDGKRSRRADDSLLVKLGLEARGNDPKVRRSPIWRQPPNFPPGEDLQK